MTSRRVPDPEAGPSKTPARPTPKRPKRVDDDGKEDSDDIDFYALAQKSKATFNKTVNYGVSHRKQFVISETGGFEEEDENKELDPELEGGTGDVAADVLRSWDPENPPPTRKLHPWCFGKCRANRCVRMRRSNVQYYVIFLTIVGTYAGLMSFGIRHGFFLIRQVCILFQGLGGDITFLRMILWVAISYLLTFLSMLITRYGNPAAAGSGIPQFKVIMEGITLKDYLSLRMSITKILGLLTAVGGGLSIGLEGPLVHLTACLSHGMMQLKFFAPIKDDKQVLFAASAAAGVAANFGTMFGGLLFSIEATSAYYPTRVYAYSAFSAITATFVFRYLDNWVAGRPVAWAILQTEFTFTSPGSLAGVGLIIMLPLAVLSGAAGAFFTVVCSQITKYRNLLRVKTKKTKLACIMHPMTIGSVVCLYVIILQFPGLFPNFFLFSASLDTLSDFFGVNQLQADPTHHVDWNTGLDLNWDLFIFSVLIFVSSVLCITLPVPSGVLHMNIVTGAGLGRLYGEVLRNTFGFELNPSALSICGAAAFLSGSTHALSSSILIVEMANRLDVSIYTVISVLIATAVSKTIYADSIYDSSTRLLKLPYLPDMKGHLMKETVNTVMERHVVCMSKDSTLATIKMVLQETAKERNVDVIAVVDDKNTMQFMGCVLKEDLQKLLKITINGGEEETKPKGRTDWATVCEIPFFAATSRVEPNTPLDHAHSSMVMMQLSCLFVTENNVLVGCINRDRLSKYLTNEKIVTTDGAAEELDVDEFTGH